MKEHAECLHPEKWALIESELRALRTDYKTGQKTLDEIHHRLFVGNGTPSISIRVDRHEQLLRGLVWTTGTLVTSMIVAGVGLVISSIFRGLK